MTEDFIDILLREVRLGYGFVPLIGSGLSAPAGIPVGAEFGNYIFYYLNEIIEGKRLWNPADPIWPKMEEINDSASTLKNKLDAARKWLETWEQNKRGTALEAIGSLADWRSALTFLSRLPEQGTEEQFATRKVKEELKVAIKNKLQKRIDEETDKDKKKELKKSLQADLEQEIEAQLRQRFFEKLELRAPDDTVVDSAFIHVTKDRQPTLAHMMLAHCADALRIQTILTTNFDTLIEEAFSRQGVYLTTFDVHHEAGLPTAQLVLAQRSILKLHGGRYGLRADYTLDEDPSKDDQNAFAKYFAARSNQHTNRKHLIVMGVSGADSRTMKLIKHAVSHHEKLNVFWVFFRMPKGETIKWITNQLEITTDRFHYTVQADVGLLLLHLYQSHYLSLPPSGADYASHFVFPPQNYPPEKYDMNALTAQAELIKQTINEAANAGKRVRGNRRSLIAVDGQSGASSAASQVYETLRGEYHAIWLELDLYVNVADFLIVLYDAVVQKLGIAMVTPPISQMDADTCIQCIKNLIAGNRRPFLVFANGRDGPGSAISKWKDQETEEFWEKTAALVDDLSPNTLILVVLTGNSGLQVPKRGRSQWTCVRTKPCLIMSADDIFTEIQQRPPKDWPWEEQRFAFAITLFRRSRYPAALTTWGLIKATKRLSTDEDNDEYRAIKCEEFITSLMRHGAIRRQPGGMIWMHADIRKRLYKLLLGIPRLKSEEASCHQGIADWYVKLFRASNDPHAALESLHHRLRCAEVVTQQIENNSKGIETLSKDELLDCEDLQITSILESVETLELARDRILTSARSTISFQILSRLKDRITSPRKEPAFSVHKKEWQQLAIVCENVLRDFARARGQTFEKRTIQTSPPKVEDPHNLRRLIMKRQDADGLLHDRQYGKCEKIFEKLFRDLGIQTDEPLSIRWAEGKDNSALVTRMRRTAKEWRKKPRSEKEMQLAVRGLRGYMFLQMLISQASGWRRQTENAHLKREVDHSHIRLRFAESIYTLATSITRYIQDHDFLQVENTYLRTHYGVLLSELCRFKEAHRRLNEATGYLSQSSKAEDGLVWAVIDIRRAETYLYQSRNEFARAKSQKSIRPSPYARFGGPEVNQEDLYRSAGAYMDDMRYALDRAKTRFINHRKDMWWWTLLLELELEYFNERRQQRLQIDPEATPLWPREIADCVEAVKKGLLVAHSDGVRLARMLECLMSICGIGSPVASGRSTNVGVGNGLSILNEHAREVRNRLQDLDLNRIGEKCDLVSYIDFVKKKLDPTKNAS